jgi:hypothetical protein
MRDETLRRLDLDLKDLTKDFLLHSAWVKRVIRVERPPGRLRVFLEYRKPVAVVILNKVAQPIDDEGVPLDPTEIEFTSTVEPYMVKGINEPLIPILDVDAESKPRYGVPWERVTRDGEPTSPDLMLARAARIAGFLQKQPTKTPLGRPAPRIGAILIPGEPINSFLVRDGEQHLILWGKPPGDEEPGELSAEARWTMLLEWVDRNGPICVKPPECLIFSKDGVKFYTLKKKQPAR